LIQSILDVSNENRNNSIINASIFSLLSGLPDPKNSNNPNNLNNQPNQNKKPSKFSIFVTIFAIL
jgi:hypothetical protein